MKQDFTLNEAVKAYVPIEGHDALVTDAKMTEYILDHCEIIFKPDNRFFCLLDVTEADWGAYEAMLDRFEKEFAPRRIEAMEQMMEARAFRMGMDFGHTTPNWSDVIKLGFVGLKKRAEECAAKEISDEQKKRFYSAVLQVYQAAERFIKRVIERAEEENKTEIAGGLKNLLVSPPQTMFEALQMLVLYYTLQHRAEATWIRSYGRVDQLVYPFYCKEDKEEARRMARDFIAELQCQNESANQPFSLGGSDKDGNDLVNELSYVLLEEYIKLNPPRVKIHILCSDHMPEQFLKLALDGIRKGANSLLFMGDTTMKKALRRLGIAEEDITDYHIDGCYECGGFGELTGPATSRINIAKALELVLNKGQDVKTGYNIGLPIEKEPVTFEEFYQEFLRQLDHICECTKKYVAQMEEIYPRIHAAPFFSSTYPLCIENGTDIFADFGAKYNNSSITACGLGTAVDSLMGVKKIVYDDKLMSLKELNELMKNNWAGNETLRRTAKNKFPKFGMADSEVDKYAADIVEFLGSRINRKTNAMGGVHRMGMYSITWRWDLGEGLGATPDGRYAGETISLNSGASFGGDREGATAHILSVTSLDATNAPTAMVLDLDLHSSAVKGTNGLDVMYATLKTYLDNGGFAVHYNVLNAEVLKDAQINPENYPNLQVRLCGWNVLFNRLYKEEQDEYIMRAEEE